MIYKLKDTGQLNKEINDILKTNNAEINQLKNTGSCLYNVRKIKQIERTDVIEINENSRCNFEIFENGLLLRINDNQHYYAIALTETNCIEIVIQKGKEKVFPISNTAVLIALGFKKEYLRNNWFLNGGFYNERLKLSIRTKEEYFELDSQGSNYKSAIKFFEKTKLKIKNNNT